MEQNIQQADQAGVETKLPIKTKIATWGTIFFGLGLIILGMLVIFSHTGESGTNSVYAFCCFLISLVLIVPAIFLLAIKKRFSIVFLIIILAILFFLIALFLWALTEGMDLTDFTSTVGGWALLFFSATTIILFILYLLDIKNYWRSLK